MKRKFAIRAFLRSELDNPNKRLSDLPRIPAKSLTPVLYLEPPAEGPVCWSAAVLLILFTPSFEGSREGPPRFRLHQRYTSPMPERRSQVIRYRCQSAWLHSAECSFPSGPRVSHSTRTIQSKCMPSVFSQASSASRVSARNSTNIFPSNILTNTRSARATPPECIRCARFSAPCRVRHASVCCVRYRAISTPHIEFSSQVFHIEFQSARHRPRARRR